MIQGQIGTYKIDYLKPTEGEIVYTRMFDKIEAALDFGHELKGKWLVFQKDGMSDTDYSWKLLPYGAYKSFNRAILIDSMWWVIIGIAAFVLVWWIMKFFKKAGSIPGVA